MKPNKTKEEFNLSEKINYEKNVTPPMPYTLFVEDVKEFIKILKDKVSNHLFVLSLKHEVNEIDRKSLMKEIDKLAGDKLI